MARKKGTITHCSLCGKPGHTKRTCKHYDKSAANSTTSTAKKVKRSKAKEKACKHCGSTDPNHFEDICLEKVAKLKSSRRWQRCGYCGQFGHTKSACTTRLKDKALYFQYNADYRKHIYKQIISKGYGIGALVKVTRTLYNRDKHCHDTITKTLMITKHNWENVSFINKPLEEHEKESLGSYLRKRSSWWLYRAANCLTSSTASNSFQENADRLANASASFFSSFLIGSAPSKELYGSFGTGFQKDQDNHFPLPEDLSEHSVYATRHIEVELLVPSDKVDEVPSERWFLGRDGLDEKLF